MVTEDLDVSSLEQCFLQNSLRLEEIIKGYGGKVKIVDINERTLVKINLERKRMNDKKIERVAEVLKDLKNV